MLEASWLERGTLCWKRSGENTFNVLPGSSILLGLLNLEQYVQEYGHDREWTEYFLDILAEKFGYNKSALVHSGARFEHPYKDESETTILVKSQSRPSVEYKVTLRNIARPTEGVEAKLKSLKNLKHTCNCSRGLETDMICSMPWLVCDDWDISREDFDKSYVDKNKIYGEKICKHEARALSLLRYPLFNQTIFQTTVLPVVMNRMSKIEVWDQQTLDNVVKESIAPLGWPNAMGYIRQLHILEKSLEKIRKIPY
jgi:hypothetical protein